MIEKFWEYTPEERERKMRCIKCKYSFTPNTFSTIILCDYLDKTGHRRGCPAENCDKFEPRKELRKGRKYD